MSEKEFTSVDELDEFLQKEFKIEGVEDTDGLNIEVEETIEEIEAEAEEDEEISETDDESEELEVSDDDEEEVEEVEAPKPAKRSKDDKRDYAFSKLRKEAADAKKALEDYNALVSRLMREAGYSDYNEFKKAVDHQLSEKEMKEKGYTKEQYNELEMLRRKNKELEESLSQTANRERYDRARSFDATVNKYAQEYRVSAKEIYDTLEKTGYNVETLLAQPNPEILIKGVLADKARPAAKPAKKSVDTEKLSAGDAKSSEIDIDELIKKELAEYKSRKGLA